MSQYDVEVMNREGLELIRITAESADEARDEVQSQLVDGSYVRGCWEIST